MDITELSMMLETLEPRDVSPQEFQSAATVAKSLKLEPEQQLSLYGLFKQATVGDNHTEKPDSGDVVATSKWEAWTQFNGFPQRSAAMAYVYLVDQMNEESAGKSSGGFESTASVTSTLNHSYQKDAAWSPPESLFDAVESGDIEILKLRIEAGNDVNQLNDMGMTPLHFAADRGLLEMVRELLANGASIDTVDASGMTPLMYAVSCDHLDVIELLLEHHADTSIVSEDGVRVENFEDISPAALALIRKG